jgi:hypothetical protein
VAITRARVPKRRHSPITLELREQPVRLRIQAVVKGRRACCLHCHDGAHVCRDGFRPENRERATILAESAVVNPRMAETDCCHTAEYRSYPIRFGLSSLVRFGKFTRWLIRYQTVAASLILQRGDDVRVGR